eukprot:12878102-Ditylum_brightwellii.AAC.1
MKEAKIYAHKAIGEMTLISKRDYHQTKTKGHNQEFIPGSHNHKPLQDNTKIPAHHPIHRLPTEDDKQTILCTFILTHQLKCGVNGLRRAMGYFKFIMDPGLEAREYASQYPTRMLLLLDGQSQPHHLWSAGQT